MPQHLWKKKYFSIVSSSLVLEMRGGYIFRSKVGFPYVIRSEEVYLNSLEAKCMLRGFTYLIVIIVKVYGAEKMS